MAGAMKIDNKWVNTSVDTSRPSNVLKNKEEYANTEAYRISKELPIKTLIAQNFDIRSWFDDNGNLVKEGYSLTKNNDGTYSLKADNKDYISYYHKRKVSGQEGNVDTQTSKYSPHEIIYDSNGKLIKEVYRDTYKQLDYYNENSKGTMWEQTDRTNVYDKKVNNYSGSNLSRIEEYDNYESDDTRKNNDRRLERNTYLKNEKVFDSGNLKQSNEYSIYKDKITRYPNSKETGQYKPYLQKEVNYDEMKGTVWTRPNTKWYDNYTRIKKGKELAEKFKKEYSEAKTIEEMQKVLEKYNVPVTIETPEGKTYSTSNLSWLSDKYNSETIPKETDNKYYSLTTGKEVDLSETTQYDENRFAYNKSTGATIDRYKQQSIPMDKVKYEDGTNIYPIQNIDYTPVDKDYYTNIALKEGIIGTEDSQQGVLKEYVDERNALQKALDWLDYQSGKVLGYGNQEANSGLFKGETPVIDLSKQKEYFDYGYNISKSDNKLLNTLNQPLRIGEGIGTALIGSIRDASESIKEIIFDQIRYDALKIGKYKTEFEKELETKQRNLNQNISIITRENEDLIKELSNIEKSGNFNESYYNIQDKLIKNNEALRNQSLDYFETKLKEPHISKNEVIEIKNKMNEIKGVFGEEKKKWYGILPQDNYSSYLKPSIAGATAFGLKGAENLYEFFSNPINWHPYGAMSYIGGEAILSGGENVKEMGKSIVTNPIGSARDLYLINKAYKTPSIVKDSFGKDYTYIEGRGKVPVEFQQEFKAYQKAFEKVAKEREIQNLNWKTIESIKGLTKSELETIKKIYKENQEAFIAGTSLGETIGLKAKRNVKDIDTFVPDGTVKIFLEKAEKELKKNNIEYTKKGDSIYFKNGEAISVHPYSMMLPNIARSQPFWRMQSNLTKRTPEGIRIARPEGQVFNKITDAYRYSKNPDQRLLNERPDLIEKSLGGKMPRYPKDIAWGDFILRGMLKQDLAKAQNYPPLIKQIAQYRAGQGLEWIKPYKEKGMVEEATAKPYYYTGKTPNILSGLKYIKNSGVGKDGKVFMFADPISATAYRLSKYDYSPISKYLIKELKDIKYPVNTNDYKEFKINLQPDYKNFVKNSYKNLLSNRNYIPISKIENLNKPYNSLYSTNYPTINPNNISETYNPYQSYKSFNIKEPIITEEETDETTKNNIRYDKKEEKKKSKYKKKNKNKNKLSRLQDPFFRFTGKKKYGMDLNKILRDRYGNIYA